MTWPLVTNHRQMPLSPSMQLHFMIDDVRQKYLTPSHLKLASTNTHAGEWKKTWRIGHDTHTTSTCIRSFEKEQENPHATTTTTATPASKLNLRSKGVQSYFSPFHQSWSPSSFFVYLNPSATPLHAHRVLRKTSFGLSSFEHGAHVRECNESGRTRRG